MLNDGGQDSSKNKVYGEQMRQACSTPHIVISQVIPPTFNKIQKNHKINSVTGFLVKISGSGHQRAKTGRHGEEAADILVTVTVYWIRDNL